MALYNILDNLPTDWRTALNPIIKTDKFNLLLSEIKNSKSIIYPPTKDIFTAYISNPISQVKVVIIGQDPYHGQDQAHGLSFSVKQGNRQPPSLQNIFKELHSDLNMTPPDKLMGDLSSWAKQGVFLINSVLTVEKSSPNSHQALGWEEFTDYTIQLISKQQENVVFVLWGKFAQKKEALIDTSKHLIISSPHPSPFSARRGFFGSKPFSKINDYLKSTQQEPINWKIN